jgi:very-short-patch-repair endonuclease
VEIDGDSHAETITHDAARTRALEENGYRVIRFTNSEVHRSFKEVLEAILKECQR